MLRKHCYFAAIAISGVINISSAVAWEALPSKAPEPSNNPTTATKVELGSMLYHDPRLSSTGTVSCASCHNVMSGGDDSRPVSMGVNGQTGGRSAPTVWNSAFNAVQFWDGRAASLEDQAAGPVTNPIEMGMKSWDVVVARLNKIDGYKQAFTRAFGAGAITKDNATKAIAAYERTLITPNSPFDKYVKGNQAALTKQQIVGMKLFKEKGCSNCHSGPAFGGSGTFMKFPLNSNGYFESQYKFSKDLGRYEVTKKSEDKHLWKVPTLRNIAVTAPYFHNGSVKTLEQAIKVMGKTQLKVEFSTKQIDDIAAFLQSLTGQFPKQQMPRLPAMVGTSFN